MLIPDSRCSNAERRCSGGGIFSRCKASFCGGLPVRSCPDACTALRTCDLIIDEPVEGYFPFRAHVEQKLRILGQSLRHGKVLLPMCGIRNHVHGPATCAVPSVTPLQGCFVEIVVVPEGPSGQEVVLDKSDKPFMLRGMSRQIFNNYSDC